MNDFTPEQAERFIKHVAECHSWYKHLSLLHGGEFIIVAAPEAGRNFPSEHPRLPFGNTKKGYQKAFGLLGYYYSCSPGEPFFCEWGSPSLYEVSPSYTREEVFQIHPQHRSIRLFPYVSCEFGEAITYDCHKDDIEQILHGYEHEKREILISLYKKVTESNAIWQENAARDKSWYDTDWKTRNPDTLTPEQVRFLKLNAEINLLCGELHDAEVKKIREAVNGLRIDV